MNERIAIIGGGITGLTLAWLLNQRGEKVSLFEAGPRLGGWIESEQKDGFLLEHGPNTVLATQAMRELIQKLGLESQLLLGDRSKTRYVVSRSPKNHRRILCEAPHSLLSALKTPLLSWRGKCRFLAEPFFSSRGPEDESVMQFSLRHFGREFSENILATAVGGVYAGNPERLSFRSAFPRGHAAAVRYRSVLAAAAIAGIHRSGAKRQMISFTGGLQTLIGRLAQSLGDTRVKTSCSADSLQPQKMGAAPAFELFSGRTGTKISLGVFDRVLITIPAKPSAALLAPFDSSLASEIAEVPYAGVGVMHLAVPRTASGPLDGFGVLFPPHLGRGLLGIVFSSSMFPGRAPPDQHLLTCFSGGMLFPEAADVNCPGVQEKLFAEVSEVLELKAPPRLLSARHLPSGIPNYPVGHHLLEEKLQKFESEHLGIQVRSQWRGGVGVLDRVGSALGIH